MASKAAAKKSGHKKKLDYSGLHAFLFVDHVAPKAGTVRDVMMKIWKKPSFENGQVLFAHDFVGPFLGFAHLRAEDDDLESMERLVAELQDEGARCTLATEVGVYQNGPQAKGTKRSGCEIVGLVKIWTNVSPREVVQSLGDDELGENVLGGRFRGASLVLGDFDVLLEVQDSTFEPLAQTVLEIVRGWAGVERIEAGFADLRNET
jgi:hypothetical protein